MQTDVGPRDRMHCEIAEVARGRSFKRFIGPRRKPLAARLRQSPPPPQPPPPQPPLSQSPPPRSSPSQSLPPAPPQPICQEPSVAPILSAVPAAQTLRRLLPVLELRDACQSRRLSSWSPQCRFNSDSSRRRRTRSIGRSSEARTSASFVQLVSRTALCRTRMTTAVMTRIITSDTPTATAAALI
jgi:hypothetical protein